jgi:hypothetical protein
VKTVFLKLIEGIMQFIFALISHTMIGKSKGGSAVAKAKPPTPTISAEAKNGTIAAISTSDSGNIGIKATGKSVNIDAQV